MSEKDTLRAKITADTGAAIQGVSELDTELLKLKTTAEEAEAGVGGIGDGAAAGANEAEKRTKDIAKSFRDLGIRSDEVADRQRKKFTDAYDTIANSGTASAEEITRAQKKLEQQLERVDRSVGKTSEGFDNTTNSSNSFLQALENIKSGADAAATALAVVATAAASIFAAIGASITDVNEKAQDIQIGASVSGLGNSEKDLVRFQKFAAAVRAVGFDTEKAGDILKDFDDRVGDLQNAGSGPLVDFMETVAPRLGLVSKNVIGDADKMKAAANRLFKGKDSLENLVDLINRLQKAGATEQDYAFFLEAMAGDAKRLLPLIKDNAAEMNRLGDAAQATGAFFDQGDLDRLKDYREQIRTMYDSIQALGLALVEAGVLDAIITIVQKITSVVQFLTDNVNPTFLKWGAIIGIIAIVLGSIAITVGFIAVGIASILPALTTLGITMASVSAFFTTIGSFLALLVSVPVLIGAAVLAILALIYTFRAEIGNFIGDVIRSIPAIASAVADILVQIWQNITEGVSLVFKSLIVGFSMIWQNITSSVGVVIGGLRDGFLFLWTSVRDFAINAFMSVFQWITGKMKSILEFFKSIPSKVAGFFKGDGGSANVPGFKKGGYTGDGGVNDVAGVTHGKEFVLRSEAVKKYGRSVFEKFNNLAVGATAPMVPAMAGAGGGGSNGGGGSTVNVSIGGESFRMQTDENTAQRFARAAREEAARRSYRQPRYVGGI